MIDIPKDLVLQKTSFVLYSQHTYTQYIWRMYVFTHFTLLWANPEEAPETHSGRRFRYKRKSHRQKNHSRKPSRKHRAEGTAEETNDIVPTRDVIVPLQEKNTSTRKNTVRPHSFAQRVHAIDQRIELLNQLHLAPNVLPALQTLALHGPLSLRKEMLTLLEEHPEDPTTYAIASAYLPTRQTDTRGSICSSGNLKTTKAAQIFQKRAENKKVSSKERRECAHFWRINYPKFLKRKIQPRILTADPLARAIFSAGSAVLGGNLFATLGRLSQGDDGAALV